MNANEALRSELLSTKGIGAETADVILVYALYQPSFVIDAYTRRFLSRLGFDFADDLEIRDFFVTKLLKGRTDIRLFSLADTRSLHFGVQKNTLVR